MAAQTSAGPDTSMQRVTLTQALEVALHHSPDLLISSAIVDSARAEQRIARALPNPSYVASPNTPYQYGATISLDVGPQRLYRTRASAVGVRATRFDRRDAVRQLTLNVRRAFYDLLLADTLEHLATARREIVRQVLASDSVRLRTGDIPERNLFRSEGELARAEADLARAHLATQNASLGLQGLIGISSPDPNFTISGDLRYAPIEQPNDSVLFSAALQNRPDLAASAERVRQSRIQRQLAASSLVPVPQLSYVRQFTTPFESGHFYSFGLALEVPILNLYQGQRERAAAGASAAQFAEQRTSSQVRREVTSAIGAFRTQRALVERFQAGLLTKTDASVEAARFAYSRGATSLLDVLDAVRDQQDVRTDYYTALHDYWISSFALAASTGSEAAGDGH